MTPEEHVPRPLSREEVEKRGVRYVTNATASAMRAIAHGADPAQLIHGYLDAARILRLKLDEAERFIGDLSKDVAARDERIEALTEVLREARPFMIKPSDTGRRRKAVVARVDALLSEASR